jgi:hypothetical protein
MSYKFETLEELEHFKDTAMLCVCGRLMTGLHMQGCLKLKKLEAKIKEAEK